MTNRYRILSVVGKATYGDEEQVDLDLSPSAEKDELDNGHLELVPRTYRVLSDNFSGGPQGSTYDAVFRVETEQALIQGGHIERVDEQVSEDSEQDGQDLLQLAPGTEHDPPADVPAADTTPATKKKDRT